MPIPYIERLRTVFPSAWLADAYGLTETVSGDTFLDRESTVSKLGSVGRPCQYLELDVWDEAGAAVPPGDKGEVVVRGPKVFAGYWRDPEATAKAFAGMDAPRSSQMSSSRYGHGRPTLPRLATVWSRSRNVSPDTVSVSP